MDMRSVSIFARRGSAKRTSLIVTALALAAALGCGNDLYKRSEIHPAAGQTNATRPIEMAYRNLLQMHRDGDRQALRVREDPQRQRLWVLTMEHVYVYDTRKLALIRQIPLPAWSTADFMCAPAMALDRRGAAFVSNNVQPRLLEIDPETFQSHEHELTLVSARKWDIGFGALAFAPDGLFAVSSVGGVLFRIDLPSQTATEIVLSQPVPEACGE